MASRPSEESPADGPERQVPGAPEYPLRCWRFDLQSDFLAQSREPEGASWKWKSNIKVAHQKSSNIIKHHSMNSPIQWIPESWLPVPQLSGRQLLWGATSSSFGIQGLCPSFCFPVDPFARLEMPWPWLRGPVWEDASLSKATWKEISRLLVLTLKPPKNDNFCHICQKNMCLKPQQFWKQRQREVGLLTPGPPWQFLSALPNSRAPQRLFDSARRFATPWRVLPGRREVRCGYGAAEQLGFGFWRSLRFCTVLS